MRFNIYYLLGQYIILCHRGNFAIVKAIIGEQVREAEEGEYPSVVSIKKITNYTSRSEDRHVCTGILVSKQDVLTAAHCFDYIEQEGTEIIIGSNDLNEGLVYYPYWWTTYQDWVKLDARLRRYTWNDIAVIRLFEEIPDDIIPAIISNMTNPNLYGLTVQVAGWGRQENAGIPSLLQTVDMKIISNYECANQVERLKGRRIGIHIRILCTFTTPYALLSRGDSGGPVFFDNALVAINLSTVLLRVRGINEEKVNHHLGVKYYENFINNVITNDRVEF